MKLLYIIHYFTTPPSSAVTTCVSGILLSLGKNNSLLNGPTVVCYKVMQNIYEEIQWNVSIVVEKYMTCVCVCVRVCMCVCVCLCMCAHTCAYA